jgi:octaprenyl-diphosphate synthase
VIRLDRAPFAEPFAEAVAEVPLARGLGAGRARASQESPRVPREGQGRRLVLAVCRGLGARSWSRAERAAGDLVEAYNRWVHGALAEPARVSWLDDELRRFIKLVRSRASHEGPLARRVFARLVEGALQGAHAPLLEGVTFARFTLAAAALVCELDDATHETVDGYGEGLGLLWELSAGPVEARALGSLAGVARAPAHARGDALTLGRWLTREGLEGLAEGPGRAALGGLAEEVALGAEGVRKSREARRFTRSEPLARPLEAPRRGAALAHEVAALGAQGLDRCVGEALEEALDELPRSSPASLSQALWFLRHQGGKRLRALLTLLAASAAGGEPMRAVGAASLVEWLHQSSLVLDDMLDEAPLRRGVGTLHTVTSAPFSVLTAGSLLHAISVLAEREAPGVRAALLDAATMLADGERMEVALGERGAVGRTEYMRIIEAKTARLFSCAALVGAHAVGASKRQARALGTFGKEVGIAFQIVDDTLDYVGDEATLGKRPGTDHAARKVTLPLLFLAARDEVAPRDLLEQSFDAVRARVLESGSGEEALGVARKHVGLALKAVSHLPAEEALARFAVRLVERRA